MLQRHSFTARFKFPTYSQPWWRLLASCALATTLASATLAQTAAAETDILLEDWLIDLPIVDHPQLQPLFPTTTPVVEDIPEQSDSAGYLRAPARAPVGSRVRVALEGTETSDWLILVDPDAPDDTMTDNYNRRSNSVGDETVRFRRASGFPGMQELRLLRSGEGIIARQSVELFDIDIDMLAPADVSAGESFDVFLNPVMSGHLIITDPDHDPEDVADRYNRMRYGVRDGEGPGMFSRTAPDQPGLYELRFHFNMGADGRLMARAPIRVVEGEAPAATDDDRLAELEARIKELTTRLDDVTLAEAHDLRNEIAALGLPALGLLVNLLERELLSPQMAFAFMNAPSPATLAPVATGAPVPASTGSAAPGSGPYQVTGVDAQDVLNVRNAPGADHMIVGMLAPGATNIAITGQTERAADGGTWWQITDPTLPGGAGWVNAQFLQPAPDTTEERLRVTGVEPNAVLYLRGEPSPDAAIVGILQPDASGIASTGHTARDNGTRWVELRHPDAPGGLGWAKNTYLTADEQTPPGPTIADLAEGFTRAPGYTEIDPEDLDYTIEQILHYAPASAMTPGADLSPLVKAVVALQSQNGRLPVARYHLRYGEKEVPANPDHAPEPLSVIEIRRFNLGPALHRQLVESDGAENVLDAQHFGEDRPNVSWRLVTRGLRGTDAMIVAASHREIETPEADCLGFHCQMGQAIIPHLTDWDMHGTQTSPSFRPSYDELWRGGPSSAAALDLLALYHGLAEASDGDARWRSFEWREGVTPGDPFVEVIIETGIGHETVVDVAMRDSHVMDTSVDTVWFRLRALSGGDDAEILPGFAAEYRHAHQ
ncbi:MAG: SH3 domain-containing protein [Pararhodobacter sp.]|nr:SH3 domain-containing protein [Pararhodobacter sp.]